MTDGILPGNVCRLTAQYEKPGNSGQQNCAVQARINIGKGKNAAHQASSGSVENGLLPSIDDSIHRVPASYYIDSSAMGQFHKPKKVAVPDPEFTDDVGSSDSDDSDDLSVSSKDSLKDYLHKQLLKTKVRVVDKESDEKRNTRLLLERYELITKTLANALGFNLQQRLEKDFQTLKFEILTALANLKIILSEPNNGIIHLENDDSQKPQDPGYALKLFLSPLETISAGFFVKLGQFISPRNTSLHKIYGELVSNILGDAAEQEIKSTSVSSENENGVNKKFSAYQFDILIAEIYDNFKSVDCGRNDKSCFMLSKSFFCIDSDEIETISKNFKDKIDLINNQMKALNVLFQKESKESLVESLKDLECFKEIETLSELECFYEIFGQKILSEIPLRIISDTLEQGLTPNEDDSEQFGTAQSTASNSRGCVEDFGVYSKLCGEVSRNNLSCLGVN